MCEASFELELSYRIVGKVLQPLGRDGVGAERLLRRGRRSHLRRTHQRSQGFRRLRAGKGRREGDRLEMIRVTVFGNGSAHFEQNENYNPHCLVFFCLNHELGITERPAYIGYSDIPLLLTVFTPNDLVK